jgi:dihydroorotase
MKLLLRAARLIDPALPGPGPRRDWYLDGGVLRPAADAPADAEVLTGTDLCVSVGWFDARVHGTDPGYEAKEDLHSLSRAAAAGGFTEVALLPNTRPVVQTKEGLHYIRRFSEGDAVRLLPMAALTVGTDGQDFTELLDLHTAGALAFTDGVRPIWNADLLVKSLQYLAQVGGLVVQRPEEPTLTRHGQMHEGPMSTRLGLKGIPALNEELSVQRDLALLAYAAETFALHPRLHFATLSTAGAVAQIRQARARGLAVTADVAAHQLALTDEALADFDTHKKVNPPLRREADRQALWAGLADGTIDAIVSDHHPQDDESKNLEFDQAEFGMSALETAFAVANTHRGPVPLERIIAALTTGPRRVFNRPAPVLAEGQPAHLTVFDAAARWTVRPERFRSKSHHSAFAGTELTGRVLAIIHNGHVVRQDQ